MATAKKAVAASTVFHVCKDIDLSKFNGFEDVMVKAGIRENYSDYYSDTPRLHDDFGPCYLRQLEGSEKIPEDYIPLALGAATHYLSPDEIVIVSVTSQEANYKAWLEQAENYPGATITAAHRPNSKTPRYTAYLLAFPVTPADL